MKLISVQSMYTMSPLYHMNKGWQMEKLKRVISHIKLISIHRRLFWMHFDVHDVV
jgi:hypothetical protein